MTPLFTHQMGACDLQPINTSDTFPRWHHHSVYSLFSYRTHLCPFFPRKFCAKILHLNSLHPFPRWRHRYICCLFSYCTHFCAFFLQIFDVFQLSLIHFHNNFFVFLKCCPSLFCAKNSTDKFARWCYHSVYSSFSY